MGNFPGHTAARTSSHPCTLRRCWQLLSILHMSSALSTSDSWCWDNTQTCTHTHGLLDVLSNIHDREDRAVRAELDSVLFFSASILLCFWGIFKHCKCFQLFSGPDTAAQLRSRYAAPFSASLLPGSQGKAQQAVQSSSVMQTGLWENWPRNIFGWWKDYSWIWNILWNYASGAENQL